MSLVFQPVPLSKAGFTSSEPKLYLESIPIALSKTTASDTYTKSITAFSSSESLWKCITGRIIQGPPGGIIFDTLPLCFVTVINPLLGSVHLPARERMILV